MLYHGVAVSGSCPPGTVPVAVGVGVITGVASGEGVGVVISSQIPLVTVLESSVTAPFRASSCPSTVAPVFAVMDVSAKMWPTKVVPVPKVAELPTCQKTRQNLAPLMRLTVLFDAVVRVLADLEYKDGIGISLCVERQSSR